MLQRVKDYFEYEAISQSYLKELLFGKKEAGAGISMGSMIDTIVSGDDFFDEYYVLSNDEMPSAKMQEIVDLAFTFSPNPKYDEYAKAIEQLEYVGNRSWGMEKKVEKVTADSIAYINQKILSKGKQIVNHEDYTKANLLALKVSQQLNDLNLPNLQSQFPVYQTIQHLGKDYKCKGLLDFVSIDDTITPIDVKYTSMNFEYAAKKFRYDIQAAFYTELLKLEYPDKVINPFLFVVVHDDATKPVEVYSMDEDDLYVGKAGAKVIYSTTYTPHAEHKNEYDVYGFTDAFALIDKQEEEFSIKPLKLWT